LRELVKVLNKKDKNEMTFFDHVLNRYKDCGKSTAIGDQCEERKQLISLLCFSGAEYSNNLGIVDDTKCEQNKVKLQGQNS